MRRKIMIVAVVAIVIASIFAYLYLFPRESTSEMSKVPIYFQGSGGNHMLVSIGGEPYLVSAISNDGKTRIYFTEIKGKERIDLTEEESAAEIDAQIGDANILVSGGKYYIYAEVPLNRSSMIVVFDGNLKYERTVWIENLTIRDMGFFSGEFYLLAIEGRKMVVLATENFEDFTPLYEFNDVDLVMNSQFITSDNSIYLAYLIYFGAPRGWMRAAVLRFTPSGEREILNLTFRIFNIFLTSMENSILFYVSTDGKNSEVYRISGDSGKAMGSANSAVFFHDQSSGIFVGFDGNLTYSKDGFKFRRLCEVDREFAASLIYKKNSTVISEDTVYMVEFNADLNMYVLECPVHL